jgi:hypothetical protein
VLQHITLGTRSGSSVSELTKMTARVGGAAVADMGYARASAFARSATTSKRSGYCSPPNAVVRDRAYQACAWGRDAGVSHAGRGTAPVPRSSRTAPRREQVRARSLSARPASREQKVAALRFPRGQLASTRHGVDRIWGSRSWMPTATASGRRRPHAGSRAVAERVGQPPWLPCWFGSAAGAVAGWRDLSRGRAGVSVTR